MLIELHRFEDFVQILAENKANRYVLLVDKLHGQLCLAPYPYGELKNKPDLDTFLYSLRDGKEEIEKARDAFQGRTIEDCAFYVDATVKRSD